MVHLDGENVALRDKVQRLQEAASLTQVLVSQNEVRTSCEFHVNTKSQLAVSGQSSISRCGSVHQDDRLTSNAHGENTDSQRNVFHWTGVDICLVAKQRDDAIKEAMTAAADTQCAKRELFLTNAQLQAARAVEESAAQVVMQQSFCTRLLTLL